jgi:hypothetical protein
MVWLSLVIALVMGATAGAGGGGERCSGPLPQRLLKSAIEAPVAAQSDGRLYGLERWRKPTSKSYLGLHFPGLLSCAYTVSAIFRGACHPIGDIASVQGIDKALRDWPRIDRAKALRPGDVVFWRPTGGTVLGFKCPGHWHVGISLGGEGTIDNDWWSGMPKQGKLERSCTIFAYGRRAPEAPASAPASARH